MEDHTFLHFYFLKFINYMMNETFALLQGRIQKLATVAKFSTVRFSELNNNNTVRE